MAQIPVYRNLSDQNIEVPITPASNYHAASKYYADGTVISVSSASTTLSTVADGTDHIFVVNGVGTGPDAHTLSDGVRVGQKAYYLYASEGSAGNAATLTGATMNGWSSYAATAPGHTVSLMWTAAGWIPLSNNGGTLS